MILSTILDEKTGVSVGLLFVVVGLVMTFGFPILWFVFKTSSRVKRLCSRESITWTVTHQQVWSHHAEKYNPKFTAPDVPTIMKILAPKRGAGTTNT